MAKQKIDPDWQKALFGGKGGMKGIGGLAGGLGIGALLYSLLGTISDGYFKNKELNMMNDDSKDRMLAEALQLQGHVNRENRDYMESSADRIRQEGLTREMMSEQGRQMGLDRIAALSLSGRPDPNLRGTGPSANRMAEQDMMGLAQLTRRSSVLDDLGM